jgi:MGT family glycosyltransferase
VSSTTVVGFCAEGLSHMRTLMAPAAALARRGARAHVLAPAELAVEVERGGATFVDLYAGRPIAELDDSVPIPCRNVTFAGVHAEAVASEVERLKPDLILYETYCTVAVAVARLLGVAAVNVSPNHDLVPERELAARAGAREVAISERCLAAAGRLRDVHGIADAGPFYYMAARSPSLNLYPEPEEFLPEEDRAGFEPLAFFGSLDPSRHRSGPRLPRAPQDPLRVLISFGTILWRYFEAEALAVLATLADGCERLTGIEVTVSLGGHPLAAGVRSELARANLTVVDFVEQSEALARTDVLVTHHGLNSTHEAIFHEVPMVSHPFFGDQPALARRCQDLGLAVDLGADPGPEALALALEQIEADREGFASRLAEARGWELRPIAGRDRVLDRIEALSAPRGSVSAGRG